MRRAIRYIALEDSIEYVYDHWDETDSALLLTIKTENGIQSWANNNWMQSYQVMVF